MRPIPRELLELYSGLSGALNLLLATSHHKYVFAPRPVESKLSHEPKNEIQFAPPEVERTEQESIDLNANAALQSAAS